MLNENLCHCPACPWRGICQQLEERCNRLTSSNVVLEETQSYLVEKCKQLGQVSARRIAELESILAQRRDSAAELELLRENLESLHAINTKYSLKEAECSRLRRELEEAERRETILLEQIEVLQSTLENVLSATERAAAKEVTYPQPALQQRNGPTHSHDGGLAHDRLPPSVGPMMEAVLRLQQSGATSDPPQHQTSASNAAYDFRDQFEQLQNEIRRLEDSHRSTTEAVLAAAERSAKLLESREQEERNREREWKGRTQQLYQQSRTPPGTVQPSLSLPPPNQYPQSSTTTVYVPLSAQTDSEPITVDRHRADDGPQGYSGPMAVPISVPVAPPVEKEQPVPPTTLPMQKQLMKALPTPLKEESNDIPTVAAEPVPQPPIGIPSMLKRPPDSDDGGVLAPAAAPVKLMLKVPPSDDTAVQPPTAPPVKKLMLKLPPASEGESAQAPPAAPVKKLMLKLPPPAGDAQAPSPTPVKKLMLKLPPAPEGDSTPAQAPPAAPVKKLMLKLPPPNGGAESAQPPAAAPVKKLMLKLPPKPPVS
jgi:hypothetical protein